MKPHFKCASWLLLLALTGCSHLPFHRNPPAQAHSLAPFLHPSQPIELVAIELPPSEVVLPAQPIYNMREEPQQVKPPVRRRRQDKDDSGADSSDVAANATPEVSAIGQLSSGDPAIFRQQTEGAIMAIERQLNSINRKLSDSDQKTAGQIREFLKQAKAALASGDVEGAHTLAAKAQVLLAGLTQ